ncbi:MAG: TIGR04552 family protein [Deltaproteobacteria bacterium]|nr:MAG: TIGR04552 family protein [Deltaproteobacteria bacterium]
MIAQPPIPLPDLWTLGDLERMRLILRGGSVIDWRRLHFQTKEEVDHYLRLCLFEPNDPFDRGRLQSILDEAVDYLRTTFRYSVAEEVAQPAQVEDLFLLASGVGDPKLRKIACLVLKVMHVVHHVEARGLLYRARVSEDELCQLVTERVDHCIAQLRREGFPVVAAAGSVKTRHSLITKLLAKKETLAAQIYDKVRYRVETEDRDHVLPVLVRLCDLLIPFNFVVPGQTQNTLICFRQLLRDWPSLNPLAPQLQMALQEEEQEPEQNEFSGDSYKMLNFVAELPVRLPERAVDAGDGRIAFCMVELQLVDRETALANERGENAHLRYKRRQLRRVLRRLSRGLVVPRRPKPAKAP